MAVLIHDVVVGDDVAIAVDEEARTLALHELSRLTPTLI
jgi:hypothetical protein